MRLGGEAKMMPWKIFRYKLLKVARDCIIHVVVYSYKVQDRSLHCCSQYTFQLVASVACGECHIVAKNRYILHPHTQKEVTLSPQTDFACCNDKCNRFCANDSYPSDPITYYSQTSWHW